MISKTPNAIAIRDEIGISNDDAQKIVQCFKLFIVQAPCIKVKRVIKKQIESPLSTAEIAESSIAGGLLHYGIIRSFAKSDLFTKSTGVVCSTLATYTAKKTFKMAYDYYLQNQIKETVVNQVQNIVLPLFTKIDNTQCNARRLMKLLIAEQEKENISSLNHITCAVTWNKEDDLVDTISVNDLTLFNKLYKFYGYGSPYNNHENITAIQKLVLNSIRSSLNESHYDSERLRFFGYICFEEIKKLCK
ncbi:MAG TPA: hypothetical protein VL201_01535 [Patescibacteria group bacterium]|nr:hypothetical protein [Patescibacteria group bacterium]